jgi:hypothetical protein
MKNDLENIYNNILINEISQKYVKEIMASYDPDSLPFDNIFKDKLRIVIPFDNVEIFNKLVNDLKRIRGFDNFDPSSLKVSRMVKINSPTQGYTEKKQDMGLGKAISLMNVDDDLKKKYLNWFAKYKDDIKSIDDGNEHSIIISRSPIDILRMGDLHVGSRHCHAEGGGYFHCAIEEATSGGPIAIVVQTEDVEKLSDEDLQELEVFEDKDRGIQGLKAITRLRIRRYKIKDSGDNIALPETRIYGKQFPGLYETVNNFIKNRQNLDVEDIKNHYDNKNIVRLGGSYQDSSDSSLFSSSFNTEFKFHNLEYDGSNVNNRIQQFEEELEYFQNSYDFTHCNAGYDVDESEDYVYFSAYGSLKVDLGDYELSDDFPEMEDRYEITQVMDYKKIPPDFKGNAKLFERYNSFLKLFFNLEPSNMYHGILTGIREDDYSNSIIFYFSMSNGDSVSENTDDYQEFLREISDVDDQYEDIKRALLKALLKSGFISSGPNLDRYDITDEDIDNILDNLERSEYDDDDDSLRFRNIVVIKIGDDVFNKVVNNLDSVFGKAFSKYLNSNYKNSIPSTSQQLDFKSFFKEAWSSNDLSDKYDINEVRLYITENSITLNIEFDGITKNSLPVIKFLDQYSYDLKNLITHAVIKITHQMDSPQFKKLDKVYGKYFV